MSNIVSLSDRRQDDTQKLFDAHRAALVELVCAFALHSESGDHLDRLVEAQDNFVIAYDALNRETR